MLLVALALAAAPVAAAAAEDKVAPPAEMQKLLENCDAHKFETIIEVPTPSGPPKHSRLKLCGTEGQSDADWLKTLKDAVAKAEVNLDMPKAVRDQVVAALKGEIARLTDTSLAGVLPPPRASNSGTDLKGYSLLPELPALRKTAPATRAPEYAALPPLPATPPAPTRVLTGGAGAVIPTLPRPKMSFICFTPGETGDVPCSGFTRDTMVTVRADEDLPKGTSLRFVRNGEKRAEVELAQLKRGKSMRFALPAQVCSHVVGGNLEIRIVRAQEAAGPLGQEVGKDGPYDLRC